MDDVSLVIFDCDGVLVDSERLMVHVEAEFLASYGWDLGPQGVMDRFMGRAAAETNAEIVAKLGDALPADWKEQLRAKFFAAFEESLEPVDGIVQVLDALTLPTCVASSGDHEKMRVTLGITGLRPRFEGRIYSAVDVGRGKPAPDLFLYAAQQMGTPPEECVVVEDSHYGVQAARAAGMRSLGYIGGLSTPEMLAGPGTVLFDDMRDLPDLLASRGT